MESFFHGVISGLPTNWYIKNFPQTIIFWFQILLLSIFPNFFTFESILWTIALYNYYERQEYVSNSFVNILFQKRTRIIPRMLSSRCILIIFYFWWSHIFETDLVSREILELPFEIIFFSYYILDLIQVIYKRSCIQRIEYITSRLIFFLGLGIIPWSLSLIDNRLFYFYYIGALTTGQETGSKNIKLLGYDNIDPNIEVENIIESKINSIIEWLWISHRVKNN